MLVLTRRVGETLMISNDVRVTVLRVDGATVHVGIDAPKDARVRGREFRALVNAAAAPKSDVTTLPPSARRWPVS
jgi:carbon storage regulator CsrA